MKDEIAWVPIRFQTESLAVTGRTQIPPRTTGRGRKSSTGSKGSRWETMVLRRRRANRDVRLIGDRLECGTH